MFFFINLYEKEEVELLRSHGIDNYKITTIISLASLIMGILLVVIYYSFSANLKSLYLNFKYQFSNSSDHLAVVNEDGLWIKEKNGGTGIWETINDGDDVSNRTLVKQIILEDNVNLPTNFLLDISNQIRQTHHHAEFQ